MLWTNYDTRGMKGLMIEADYIGKAIKSEARDRYETSKSGAWKTWHVSPHASTKGGRNKRRSYTSTDVPGAYKDKTAEI